MLFISVNLLIVFFKLRITILRQAGHFLRNWPTFISEGKHFKNNSPNINTVNNSNFSSQTDNISLFLLFYFAGVLI